MIAKKFFCSFFFSVVVYLPTSAQNKQLDIRLDERAVDSVVENVRVSYADVLEGATPSVVSVYTAEIVSAASNRQIPELFVILGFRFRQRWSQIVRAKAVVRL